MLRWNLRGWDEMRDGVSGLVLDSFWEDGMVYIEAGENVGVHKQQGRMGPNEKETDQLDRFWGRT